MKQQPLLQVSDLTVDFDSPDGWSRALHGVDLEVYPGEILGLVGESGCGKSVTCMAILQLLSSKALVQGSILYDKQNLLTLDEKRMTQIRGRDIAMIFQDPVSSLNPVHTIGRQVVESIRYNTTATGLDPQQEKIEQIGSISSAREEAENLLARVGIPEAKQRLEEYPHQLSGGMNQRSMIAMSLAGQPQLLIADEPTTALDVTIQAQILELIRDLRKKMGMSIILVTHDLSVVAETCDRMAVMYCGRIVEEGPVRLLFEDPHHPYTLGLLASLPRIDQRSDQLYPIVGSVPAPHEMPSGCAFEPRCQVSLDDCRIHPPQLVSMADGRQVACVNPQQRKS